MKVLSHPTNRLVHPGLEIPDSRLLCSYSDLIALAGATSVEVYSFLDFFKGGLNKVGEVPLSRDANSITLWDGGLAIGTPTDLALASFRGTEEVQVSINVPLPDGARSLSSAVASSGRLVLAGGAKGTLSLVPTALGAVSRNRPSHRSGVWACDLSADCSRTVSGTDRDELFVRVFDTGSAQLVREYDRPLSGDGIVRTLFTSPGNQTVFVADCEGSAVGIFDLRQASDDPAIAMPFPSHRGLTWHADVLGHDIIAGRGPDVVEFDGRSPSEPRSIITSPGSGAVTHVAFSQDLSCIFATRRKKDAADDEIDDAPGLTTAYRRAHN